jgi:hypothetical protein
MFTGFARFTASCLEAHVQVMLPYEGEITEVALVVIVVITASVITSVAQILVVRKTEYTEIRQVNLAVSGEVRADDNNSFTLRVEASRCRSYDCFALYRKDQAVENASTAGYTAGEFGVAKLVGQCVRSERARAQAKGLTGVTGKKPVIGPGNTLDTYARTIERVDVQKVATGATTIIDPLEIARRADRDSHADTAYPEITVTGVNITGVSG